MSPPLSDAPSPKSPIPSPQNPVPSCPPPVFPWLETKRNYMAGLTRSVVEARLAQQMETEATNPYMYVNNNPITLIDPTGLSPFVDPNCGRKAARIRKALRYLCREKIWRIPYSDLRTCLYRRCNNIRVSCYAGCIGDAFGVTPGLPGHFRDHIILCPPAFNNPDPVCLTETMLHEMIHSCANLHCPGGDAADLVDRMAQSVFNSPHCPT